VADLNQLVQERANLTKSYNETLQRLQQEADKTLQPIQVQRIENQKQIDEIINTNAGLPDA
tara:strand:+ start:437 stop:619 length:183 start_codon:yes stop_codon:yes gene_type:complete